MRGVGRNDGEGGICLENKEGGSRSCEWGLERRSSFGLGSGKVFCGDGFYLDGVSGRCGKVKLLGGLGRGGGWIGRGMWSY